MSRVVGIGPVTEGPVSHLSGSDAGVFFGTLTVIGPNPL
jgi:hypothetical protein